MYVGADISHGADHGTFKSWQFFQVCLQEYLTTIRYPSVFFNFFMILKMRISQ